MGGAQNKPSQNNYKQVDPNFFRKQMINTHKSFSIYNEYDLLEKIGSGTYAEVHRGRSKRTKKLCAIKWVDKQKAKGISMLLENEFSILRELDHPNIIKIYGMYEDAKDYHIVSELIKGRELFEFFKEKKKLNEKDAFQIFHQVLLAVNHLHKNSIMHRDIKFENIIFDPESRILKLLDFGSALQYENPEKREYKCVGTPTYIAPQVIGKVYNYKCDNWSLGVFLYLLLSGYPPFAGKSNDETFIKIKTDALSFSNSVWDGISKQAKQLITALLNKNPQQRIELEAVIKHPWVTKRKNQQIISQKDQEVMLQMLKRLMKFGKLKLAQIQLGVLVFMINFVVTIDNEDSMIRCFHLIDSQGDGVITVKELVQAMVEFMDRPQKIAHKDAEEIMKKIDFNQSNDISYSEFLVAAIELQAVLTEQNLQRTFDMIDLDNSGKLSAFQLKSNLGQQLDEEYYSKLIAFFDQDKDGEISRKQFKTMMRTLIGK